MICRVDKDLFVSRVIAMKTCEKPKTSTHKTEVLCVQDAELAKQ